VPLSKRWIHSRRLVHHLPNRPDFSLVIDEFPSKWIKKYDGVEHKNLSDSMAFFNSL
jgi:hypothetical protein